MYAMMLPSGNDAAQSLAIYFGNLALLKESKGNSSIKGNRSMIGVDANIYESDYPEDEEPSSEQEQDQTPSKKSEESDLKEENMSDPNSEEDAKTIDNIIDDI